MKSRISLALVLAALVAPLLLFAQTPATPVGAGNVFVRDANGFIWELIQRATPR